MIAKRLPRRIAADIAKVRRASDGNGKASAASISDPALRAVLQEAHAERLGLWVAVWPVTMLVLSQILEWKMEE